MSDASAPTEIETCPNCGAPHPEPAFCWQCRDKIWLCGKCKRKHVLCAGCQHTNEKED